ncbi:hypothetical protein Glove_177g52 [Diversispora epigaea]|uniref:Uncharacterized protein n=1 Tax=Diversispora epigaea TaxID=1348612 RepID=A0A397IX62_9GLOM|nr:hypothetical protein Glove_177g52 [Diversispora epigaea]
MAWVQIKTTACFDWANTVSLIIVGRIGGRIEKGLDENKEETDKEMQLLKVKVVEEMIIMLYSTFFSKKRRKLKKDDNSEDIQLKFKGNVEN